MTPTSSLDEQCARAMGHQNDIVRWATGIGPPFYASDPALLDAKLAWLRKHAGFFAIYFRDKDECWISARVRIEDDDTQNLSVIGSTIHEATARLVVAVFERLKERL